MASRPDVVLAYRQLMKQMLRACQYAKPDRFTLRDHVRHAFRHGQPADFNLARIQNTLEFLRGAERERGLEHKIVKNLAFVWWHQGSNYAYSKMKMDKRARPDDPEVKDIYMHAANNFNDTIRLLNESMGLCLPTKPWGPPAR